MHIYLSAHSIITKNNTTPCHDIIKHVCINCIRIQCEYNLRTFILSSVPTIDLYLAVRVVSRIRSKSMSIGPSCRLHVFVHSPIFTDIIKHVCINCIGSMKL